MNIKKSINFIIILLISLALVLTTITTNFSNTKKNTTKIDSLEIHLEELELIKNKIKNLYPKTKKINNIEKILETLIKNHIAINIKNKKIGITCTKNEILFSILNTKIFKKKNRFSIENYKKYIQKSNITEHFFQKNIKNLLENTIINNLIKTYIKKTHNYLINVNYSYHGKIAQIKYANISKKKIFHTININNNNYFKFEKEKIKKLNTNKTYKILYFKNYNLQNIEKKFFLSKNQLNKKIFKSVKKCNKKIINFKKKNDTYVIKKNDYSKTNYSTNTYKIYLINKYKKFHLKEKLKKINQNLKTTNHIDKKNFEIKTIFISPTCKKNNLTLQIKKYPSNLMIVNSKFKNKINIKNFKLKPNYIKNTKNIIFNLKNKIKKF